MKTSYIFKTLFVGLTLTAFASCGEDLEKAEYDHPLTPGTTATVTTGEIEFYGSAIKVSLTMTVPEGAMVEDAGILVSTDPEMPLASESTILQRASKLISGEPVKVGVSGLDLDTTYYVKTFAYVANGGITYGETKTFKTDDSYERTGLYSCNFTDMRRTDAADFTALSLPVEGGIGQPVPFTPVSLGILGMKNRWGFSGSVFSPDMFQTGQATLTTYTADNLLSYEADFTGIEFPELTVTGISLNALFGEDYSNCPGNFEVYASKEPITTHEELEAAVLIGTCNFSTDPTAETFMMNEVICKIPIDFNSKSYITVRNFSKYDTDADNLGVVIAGFDLSSLKPKQ